MIEELRRLSETTGIRYAKQMTELTILTENTQRTPCAGKLLACGMIEFTLILAIFALHGSWPVPDSNEAHYINKARHYWDPSWCAGDFFLESADAHQVFYWTFGWLTQLFPMATVACIGRWLTWGLLAWTWRRLSWSIVPVPWIAVLSAALFVNLNEQMHMAGEWVIGGVEAKGFAYAAIFAALEALVRGRWQRVWILLGLATALHVLVGGWALLAAGLAWLASGRTANRAARPTLLSMLPSMMIGALLALPSVWYGLALTWGDDPAIVREANQIYVFERLHHHLAAERFAEGFIRRHLLLGVAWLALAWWVPKWGRGSGIGGREEERTATDGSLRCFISATLLFALVGLALSFALRDDRDLLASLMRYYWFRSSDAFVPVGVALLASLAAVKSWQRSRTVGFFGFALLIGMIGMVQATSWPNIPVAILLGDAPATPRADKKIDFADWRAVCDWSAANSQPDDLFLTPRITATFRWYAERPEVVNHKDIPQDAGNIVEWWRRINVLHATHSGDPLFRWHKSYSALGRARLFALAGQFGADYVIVQLREDIVPLTIEPLYQNKSFAVYQTEQLGP